MLSIQGEVVSYQERTFQYAKDGKVETGREVKLWLVNGSKPLDVILKKDSKFIGRDKGDEVEIPVYVSCFSTRNGAGFVLKEG